MNHQKNIIVLLVKILTGEDLINQAIQECEKLSKVYHIPKRVMSINNNKNLDIQTAIVNFVENKNGMINVLPELYNALKMM